MVFKGFGGEESKDEEKEFKHLKLEMTPDMPIPAERNSHSFVRDEKN